MCTLGLQGDPFKTLFVGRISYDATEKKLRREFEEYGPIKSIRLVNEKRSGARPALVTEKYGQTMSFHMVVHLLLSNGLVVVSVCIHGMCSYSFGSMPSAGHISRQGSCYQHECQVWSRALQQMRIPYPASKSRREIDGDLNVQASRGDMPLLNMSTRTT